VRIVFGDCCIAVVLGLIGGLVCQNQIMRRKILREKHYSQDNSSCYYNFNLFGRNLAEHMRILLTEKAKLTTNLS
jgi:hypothetical protein